MEKLTRRDFLRLTSAAGLALTSGIPAVHAAPALLPLPASATDRTPLGRTGIRASFLAQGTGVNGSKRVSNHTRMGEEAAVRLIRHGLDNGLNFLDTADLYGTHQLIAKAVAGLPREDYVLLSKIWARAEDWNDFSGGARAEVDRFRKELDTDFIDIMLVHCQTARDWPTIQKRVRDDLSEFKEKGVVRAVGVSCHSLEALETAVADPWTEVILARINYMGGREYSMDGTADNIGALLKKARDDGKAVIGMKVFGVGKLTGPEQMDASLRFVIGNRIVDAMTIGMMKPEEMDENIRRIGKTLSAVRAG